MRYNGTTSSKLRLIGFSSLLSAATACTGPGLSAGHFGGRAFIAFTGMLLVVAAILYVALGREE